MKNENLKIENLKDENECQVTLSPSGKSYQSLPQKSLLESGLGSGIALPFHCSNGTCGDCRAKVKSGAVECIRFHDYVLTESEKNSGVMLLCSNRAVSDVEIEVMEASQPQDIPVQQVNTRVCHIEEVSNTVIVRLKIGRGKVLRFLAGQYAKITAPGLESVLLPIASCPCETGYLEFHIPMEQTELCERMQSLRRSDRVAIEGPFGTFTIDNSTLKKGPHVFVTIDHGFAVIKPLIEHVIATELEPQCSFHWVTKDPYNSNLCRSWADAFDWFSYSTTTDLESVCLQLAQDQSKARSSATYYLCLPLQDCGRAKEILTDNKAVTVRIDELAQ